MSLRILLPAALLLTACGDKPGAATGSTSSTGSTGSTGSTTNWTAPQGGVISLETRDGLTLQADYYPASQAARPGVVLLHMIPPGNDRNNWPEAFISELTGRDWAVINVDRRGAGGSQGTAVDAYEGDAGRYDTEAAVQRLVDDGYGSIGIMGASNGTTSMIDYAAWAEGEGLRPPVVLGFLTGGTYTENQTPMDDIVPFPCVFTYQTTENAWSEEQVNRDPGNWAFHEYPDAGHGTQMLGSDAGDQVTQDLVDYFDGVFFP